MWRHIASNAMTFLIVGLFLLVGLVGLAQQQYRAPGPLADAICLKVSSGENMRGISGDLATQGAISSQTLFRLGADYTGKADQLKAGSFVVPAGSSMAEIVDLVTKSGQSTCGTEVIYRVGVTRGSVQLRQFDPASNRYVEQVAFAPGVDPDPAAYTAAVAEPDTRLSVLVTEGTTVWQVVSALNANPLLGEDLATMPAEGTLAPDSYAFAKGDTVASLIDRMASAQAKILADAWAGRADGLPYQTPQEALIMASIVEKETGVARERPEVASVFINRLNKGMKLQTDPSVIYGVTKGQGALGRGLRQSELRANTPYNTYVIDGLPPTPIANPGRASIKAALNPASTNYIFFVADGTGGHVFSDNLADHNRNVAKWRAIEAQRGTTDSSGN